MKTNKKEVKQKNQLSEFESKENLLEWFYETLTEEEMLNLVSTSNYDLD